MHQDNLDLIPDDIKPLIEHLIGTVHETMERQEFLQPVWFMLDRTLERMIPVLAPYESKQERYMAEHMIRTMVIMNQPHVDAVISMCEAWCKSYNADDPESDDLTTPVKDRPGRDDIILIRIETYDGLWVAETVVTGEPGMPRKLDTVTFIQPDYDPEHEMQNFLPARNKKDIN
jgi:hypothetical protein